MKKLITIILSALSCACMALGFAACGGDGGDNDTSPSISTPQDSSSKNDEDSSVIPNDGEDSAVTPDNSEDGSQQPPEDSEDGSQQLPDNSEDAAQPPEDSEDIHTHSYQLKSDDTHHWTGCTCGAILEKTEHSFGEWQCAEDYHFKSCACGKEVQEEHTYNDRNLCTVCGVQKGTDGVEYTLYKENGEYYYMVKSVGFAIHEPTIYIPSFFNGKKVKAIASMAFRVSSSLKEYAAKSIVLNDEITQIGTDAFNSATLSTLVIPKSVTYIGEGALSFSSLGLLVNQSSIEIKHNYHDEDYGVPEETIITNDISKVVWEKGYVFYYNEERYSLMGYEGAETDLVLPESVNGNPYVIANTAFYKNETLTSIVIPEGVTEIQKYTFSGCDSLTSVTIPDSVTSIGEDAFYSCDSLTAVYITDIAAWCAIDFYDTFSNPLFYAKNLYLNKQLVTDLVIPDGVTSIGKYAFRNYAGLTSVTIPASVTSIGGEAFRTCYSLTSVTIGNGVTSIGEEAFYYCLKLVEVINKSSLNITAGSYDNGYVGCHAKQVITDEKDSNIIKQDDYLFYNDNGSYYLLGYKGVETELILPDTVNGKTYEIYRGAFYDCDSLTSVTIPDGVTSIGSSAFYNCSSLTSITIPDGVTSIGYSVFEYCDSLTSITIPDSVTSIGDYAFSNCGSLTSITIPDSVTSIGRSAFSNCSSLTSVTIGNSVTSIGDGAFSECNRLTSITIPDGVTSIGRYAFSNCSSLTSITIPDSVTEIGYEAFEGCAGLTSIVYEGTIEQWNAISKGSDWNYNTGVYTVTCTDGVLSKSES